MIRFVFSNPKHHLEMFAPAAQALVARGHAVELISLAEVRGLTTPDRLNPATPLKIIKALPWQVRKSPSVGAAAPGTDSLSTKRQLAQAVVWRLGLGPRMRSLLAKSSVVVVPNDAVYPYQDIIAGLRETKTPWVLMQEGIRFPFPRGYQGSPYGLAGADRVCVWGQGSAEHFAREGVAPVSVAVVGNPRFDGFSRAKWDGEAATIASGGRFAAAPLAILTNPIELQGFCSLEEKYRLVAETLSAAATVAPQVPIVVRNHLQEDREAYSRVIADVRGRHPTAKIELSTEEPLFALLAYVRCAVVMASTVGLETMMFGKPLGVLELAPHGYAFEYVSHGQAVAIASDRKANGIERLLASQPPPDHSFVTRHLANVYSSSQQTAAERLADQVLQVARTHRTHT